MISNILPKACEAKTFTIRIFIVSPFKLLGIKMAKLPAEGIKTFLQMRLKGRRMPENRRWDAASLPLAICFFIWEAPAGPIVSGKMKITSIESCRRKSIKLIIILFIIYWGKFPPGEIMG